MTTLFKRFRRATKRVTLPMRMALIEKSPDWLRRVLGRPAIYFDSLFVDHGIFRLIYLNKHRIGPKAWRSAQPGPHHVRAAARRGIKTIVNLRGKRVCGSYWLEREACERHGIRLVDFQIRSRAAPSLEELRAVRKLFRTVEYPVLLHCKSGADRAGLMSALYRFLVEEVPLETAKGELSLRYGHFRQAETGILDAFLERYLADNARRPMPFFEWVETIYDPDELKASFQSKGWANRLVNSALQRE
jgi:protein tyrosine/serine phosphatase